MNHAPHYGVGATPDLFYAVPRCDCGWVGPMCWNLLAAQAVWMRHVEAQTAAAEPSRHSTTVTTAPFGGYIATCVCGWAARGSHSEVSTNANQHRAAFGPDATPDMPTPAWFDWAVETFDADVAERDALARGWGS
jgi:hypothetical protein